MQGRERREIQDRFGRKHTKTDPLSERKEAGRPRETRKWQKTRIAQSVRSPSRRGSTEKSNVCGAATLFAKGWGSRTPVSIESQDEDVAGD